LIWESAPAAAARKTAELKNGYNEKSMLSVEERDMNMGDSRPPHFSAIIKRANASNLVVLSATWDMPMFYTIAA
jgi:hypothetical protein